MKRILILLVSSVFFVLTGCDRCNDVIYDFNVRDIRFMVTNASGENLMDPDVEGNLLSSDIYVEYNGTIYRMNADDNTRAYRPSWKGLRTDQDYYKTKPIMLMFGEFSPEDDHKGEMFTIHWGDGTSDKVKFDYYVTWKRCDPKVHFNLWFNDKRIPNDSYAIEIVK